MYTLWIANKNYSSWSLRPWALMRVLDIAFEEQLRPFGDLCEDGRGFRGFSPTGKVPCLHDGATVVWDSLAIAEYLAERHAGVWPADPAARAWARCAAAEMHSGFGALRNICSMNCGVRIRLHEVSDALKADLARLEELWVDGLVRHGGPWLGGAGFGAVDAFSRRWPSASAPTICSSASRHAPMLIGCSPCPRCVSGTRPVLRRPGAMPPTRRKSRWSACSRRTCARSDARRGHGPLPQGFGRALQTSLVWERAMRATAAMRRLAAHFGQPTGRVDEQ